MAQSPDAELVAFWEGRGAVPKGAVWEPLTGGNTNALWRVGMRVVKRFQPGGETPLFGNDAVAEALALRALTGTGLAPEFVDATEGSLVYGLAPGRTWVPADGVEPVARALARLHAQHIPEGLPEVDLSVAAMSYQTRNLRGDPPPVYDAPMSRAFLHGDATAANVLVHDGAVTFIDWQCPGAGDAAHDLHLFLSPAMQVISGNEPLSLAEIETFLAAYGEGAVTQRYRALAPLYAERMRAYCLWRAARGDAGYAEAARAE